MNKKTKKIFFDMDNTLADLYGVDQWLQKLKEKDASPYIEAKPLINMNSLARLINNRQKRGYKVGIITWLSKTTTKEYDRAVTQAKLRWLKTHLGSVKFDEIHIIKYGTPKSKFCSNSLNLLFDDEINNRLEWKGISKSEKNIIDDLKNI